MTLPITGISTSIVAQAIGAGSSSLGALCTHANINKWSMNKPVRKAKGSGLTAADIYSVDCGFNIPSYSNPLDLINAAIGGTGWTYNKPQGGNTSPFRLGDFRGYDHAATNWFSLSVNGSVNAEYNTNKTFTLGSDLTNLLNFNIFSFAKGKSGLLDVGFIITNAWATTSSAYLYKISDIVDYQQLNMNILSGLYEGTWYVTPVLFSHQSYADGSLTFFNQNTTFSGTWYLLPASPVLISVGGQQGGTVLEGLYVSYESKDVDVNGYYVSLNSFIVSFTNNNTSSVSLTTTARMTDAMANGGLPAGSITIPANSSVTFELIPEAKQYESADGYPILELGYTYQSSTIITSFEINNL